jgi:glycosyltransferase involved in cell wall biosynthesis
MGDRAQGSVIGIDASRNRSGGAVAHLLGLLTAADPREHGVREVHLWSHESLLSLIPDTSWLIKHCPSALAGSLPRQLWWQYRVLASEVRDARCDALLTTDAGSLCRYEPSVVMSRDMLSFEPGEMRRYAVSMAWLRLVALRYVQIHALRHATGTIFLTRYAADVIQRLSGPLPSVRIIPHGVTDSFRLSKRPRMWPGNGDAIRCIYVSNVDRYKHQWHVVTAIARMREAGHRITLTLVGAGNGPAAAKLDAVISREDPEGAFVTHVRGVPHIQLPHFLAEADVFLFASSCENMPNTLLEGMAAGLPIACSERGPMPEVLREGGTYFDPERPESIAEAIEELITNAERRAQRVAYASAAAEEFTWSRCARETWAFLREVAVSTPKAVR